MKHATARPSHFARSWPARLALAAAAATSMQMALSAAGPQTPVNQWVFESVDTNPNPNAQDYYEKHLTDDVGTIDIKLDRISGSTSGVVEIRVMEAESTALANEQFLPLSPTTKWFSATRQNIKFTLDILPSARWYRQRWLWLEVVDPTLPTDTPGRRLLLGIRPSGTVRPPTIHFAQPGSSVSAGQPVSHTVDVVLSGPSDEDVDLYYTTDQPRGSALSVPLAVR